MTEKEKKEQESGYGWIVLWLLISVLWLYLLYQGSNSLYCFRYWGWLVSIGLFLITVVECLAPKEGTAKVVVRGGEVVDILIQWKGHTLDEDWNVIKEDESHKEPPHPLGGLRFYTCIWPIETIYRYNFRWKDVQLIQGEERPEFHEEILDYILVKPTVYSTTIKEAETKAPERYPLDIHFLVTIRVVNPYKALFVAPPNWLEKILARLNALFRGWIGLYTLDELLSLQKTNPSIVWDVFKEDSRLSFLEEWGIKIEENGIQMRDIDMPADIQEAAAAEKRMRLKAAGTASETVGMIIESMAQSTGLTTEQIKKEIKKNPDLQKEFREMAADFASRRMAIDGGAFVDIRTSGPRSQSLKKMKKRKGRRLVKSKKKSMKK